MKNDEVFIVDFDGYVDCSDEEIKGDALSGNVVSLRDWKKANAPMLTDEESALIIRCDEEFVDWLEDLREGSKLPHVKDVIRRALREFEWRLIQSKSGHQHAIIKSAKKS